METTLTVTEASRHFADVVNRAYYRGEATLLVRSGEPVARIVPVVPDAVRGVDLARKWESYPHLSVEEAEEFGRDIEESRRELAAVKDPWES